MRSVPTSINQNMSSSNRILCSLAIFLSLIYRSTSINCYYCNSGNNSACLDVNIYDPETRTRMIPIVDCNTAIPNAISYNFFCRKIVQTIFHTEKPSEVRVTRGCGWITHEKECYRDDNSDHLGTACQCFTDLCNHGEAVDPAGMTVLFLILSTCLYFWR